MAIVSANSGVIVMLLLFLHAFGKELVLLRTTWGFDDWIYRPDEWASQLAKIAADGYQGVDADLDFVVSVGNGTKWSSLCLAYNLKFVPTVATMGTPIQSSDVEDHLESLRDLVQKAKKANVSLLNVHGGYDGWSIQDAVAYFDGVSKIESASGVAISHETHRRRLFHSPWQLNAVLEALPADQSDRLKLTADLSHWVVVGSRFYDYPADKVHFEKAMSHLAQRCVLVHARVAYSEGCQVPHPGAPEYNFALEAHEAWWSRIWEAQRAQGRDCLVLPEFGPAPAAINTAASAYMPRIPFTNQPVADVNQVNEWMATRVLQYFNQDKGCGQAVGAARCSSPDTLKARPGKF